LAVKEALNLRIYRK